MGKVSTPPQLSRPHRGGTMKLEKIYLNRTKGITAYSATDEQFYNWFLRRLKYYVTTRNRLELRGALLKVLIDLGWSPEEEK